MTVNGLFDTNSNSRQCLLQPSRQDSCQNLEENAEMNSILSDLIQVGENEDLSPYTLLAVEEENELEVEETINSSQLLKSTPKIRPPSLAEISFSDGPSKEPEEGKTKN